MHSVRNIVILAGLILPSAIGAQNGPSATQSATANPKRATQQPSASVSGNTSGLAYGAVKPQKGGTKNVAANKGATSKSVPAQATSSPTDSEAPKKVVVRQGGVPEPSAQIVTDMDPAEAARKRTDSDRLLSLADENLKRLAGRTLTEQQQETVSQIDHYMTVARSALKEGDISRGHTLAMKANLLAADIAKH